MAKKVTMDWEKCRDWIQRILPTSSKIPGLSHLEDEYDLFLYLKDGTELCRLLGVLKKEDISRDIIYRTNNVSTLEERNILLFLNMVKDIFKLDKLFGENGEKIMRTYKMFPKVLEGLAGLSKKVSKGFKQFPAFSKSSKPQQESYKDNKELKDVFQGARKSAEKNEYEENLYEDYVEADTKPTQLYDAVDELITKDKSYTTRVLENLNKNFVQKNENFLLKDKFFPVLKVEKLLQLHKMLEKEFESLKFSYEQVLPIFEKNIKLFMTYAEVAGDVFHIRQFLADQQTFNPEIRDHIKELEKIAERSAPFKDDRTTYKLKDLILMPVQHLMRYPMMLENILKFAQKEERPEVVRAARKAMEMMKNVANHADAYQRDSSYIDTMDKLQAHIKDMDTDLHTFGTLLHEVNFIGMKKHNEDVYQNFNMLIFDQNVVFCNLTEDQKFDSYDWRGNPIMKTYTVKRFYESFKLKNFHEIRLTKNDRELYYTIHMIRFGKRLRIINEKTLQLKVEEEITAKGGEEITANNLREKLNDLNKKSKDSIQVTGTLHSNHTVIRYKKELFDNDIPALCPLCQKFITGKIQIGVKCNTCNEIYHQICLQNDYGFRESLTKGEENSNSFVISVNNEEEFMTMIATRGHAEKKLSKKRDGTFLVRKSKNKTGLVLSRKVDKERDAIGKPYAHHKIAQNTVGKQTWFWIEEGCAKTTLLDLVRYHQRSHFLFYPINSRDAELSDEENKTKESLEPDPEDDKEEDEVGGDYRQMPLISVKEPEYEEVPIDYEDYDHGNMTSEEAETILEKQPLHTFLLRWNKDGLRISKVQSSEAQIQHFIIKQDGKGRVSFTKNKYFNTIGDLVAKYQNVSSTDSHYLGNPYLNVVAQKRMEEKNAEAQSNQRSKSAKKKEPYSLSYFHGTMSAREAQSKLLTEPAQTFLLRMKDKKEYRISFKTKKHVQHIVIHYDEQNDKYYVSESSQFVSIGRLVKNLVENDNLISIPLKTEVNWSRKRLSAYHERAPDSPPTPTKTLLEPEELEEVFNDECTLSENNKQTRRGKEISAELRKESSVQEGVRNPYLNIDNKNHRVRAASLSRGEAMEESRRKN